jgi:hypothetical protein
MQAVAVVEHTYLAMLAVTVHQVLKAAKAAVAWVVAQELMVAQAAQIPVVAVEVDCTTHRMFQAQAVQELLLYDIETHKL